MLAQIACPSCQSKMSIPEGEMGLRHICPHCQSPFFAGKSISGPMVSGRPLAEPDPAFQKTMLGDTAPAIKFNCPRCKAPLEAASIEAGTKKPCSACGQRLQVPAASPAAAAAPPPNLNKTMMAGDDRGPALPPIKYNCPGCKKPLESPASEAGIKKPCPACGQRLQVPARAAFRSLPNPNRTMLASDGSRPQSFGGQPGYSTPTAPGAAPGAAAPAGITIGSYTISTRNFAIGAGVLILLLLLIPAIIRGGKVEDTAAAAAAAAAQKKELELANAEVERRKTEAERMNRLESDTRTTIKEMWTKLLNNERQMQTDHFQAMSATANENQKAALELKFREQQRLFDENKREMEKNQQKMLAEAKAAADASKAALTAAQQRQQTIIQAPPPPPPYYHHPPYHWRYYYPW